MDRKFFLAILLVAVIVLVVPRILPTPPREPVPASDSIAALGADSAATPRIAGDSAQAEVTSAATSDSTGALKPAPAAMPDSAAAPAPPPVEGDTVRFATSLSTYIFSTAGAEPVDVRLHEYESLIGDPNPVRLTRSGTRLLTYALASGADTVPLDRSLFTADSAAGTDEMNFRGALPDGRVIEFRYAFAADSYMVRVSGKLDGARSGEQLIVRIPNGIRSEEADTVDDIRHLAFVIKPAGDDARGINFSDLDTARAQTETDGPYRWIASKSKYFVVGLLTEEKAQGFTGLRIAPHLRSKKELSRSASATTALPVSSDGTFNFEIYAGPQQYKRLNAVGHGFANVNPYGGWFGGVIQPFATAVMKLLLWMHDALSISYGWVLILFGIAVRVVLWPLNQSAMRTQLKMQALQPEMQALQKQIKDPQQQQKAIMELYKKHGMSPATPIMGCLPMLIPLPFLFALFFVFQNTIEFRGVPFGYLADISQKDPYYILPIVMAVSMFVMSWIGIRSAPPNPQAKILSYLMPAVMLVVLRNMAAGLNLYYAVQNIASIPQQWMIAKERARAQKKT